MASSGRISAKEWERGSDWEVGPVSTRLEIHVVAGLGWAGLGCAVGREEGKEVHTSYFHASSTFPQRCLFCSSRKRRHKRPTSKQSRKRNHPNPVRQTPSTILPPQILVKRVECRARDAASSFRLGISPDEEYTADEW
ncbi:hypothetical protein HO173_003373 [Letharia columbiana]|uniref:Uncharacterized protein n=1 Tax=Letharia columbiana TaxID=112416 RepID=A0A8H6L7D3_9LECA|nr:uncharacterized protein HO173_003373 [Letharia columbiana]KAF6238406.1 hypothetical protein HO173_003373 [Letharia columbiana]